MTEFEPISAVAGGLLIGLAASLLLLADGRIAGISGVLGRTLVPQSGERAWRILFLLGLPVGAGLVGLSQGGLVTDISASTSTLIVAGAFVGVGTQLGTAARAGTESAGSLAARGVRSSRRRHSDSLGHRSTTPRRSGTVRDRLGARRLLPGPGPRRTRHGGAARGRLRVLDGRGNRRLPLGRCASRPVLACSHF